jgi:hypothetical protein
MGLERRGSNPQEGKQREAAQGAEMPHAQLTSNKLLVPTALSRTSGRMELRRGRELLQSTTARRR